MQPHNQHSGTQATTRDGFRTQAIQLWNSIANIGVAPSIIKEHLSRDLIWADQRAPVPLEKTKREVESIFGNSPDTSAELPRIEGIIKILRVLHDRAVQSRGEATLLAQGIAEGTLDPFKTYPKIENWFTAHLIETPLRALLSPDHAFKIRERAAFFLRRSGVPFQVETRATIRKLLKEPLLLSKKLYRELGLTLVARGGARIEDTFAFIPHLRSPRRHEALEVLGAFGQHVAPIIPAIEEDLVVYLQNKNERQRTLRFLLEVLPPKNARIPNILSAAISQLLHQDSSVYDKRLVLEVLSRTNAPLFDAPFKAALSTMLAAKSVKLKIAAVRFLEANPHYIFDDDIPTLAGLTAIRSFRLNDHALQALGGVKTSHTWQTLVLATVTENLYGRNDYCTRHAALKTLKKLTVNDVPGAAQELVRFAQRKSKID